jgi:predicted dehydrogenase
MSYRLGIIGLGAIGDRIRKALNGLEAIQVYAVCDINANLAKQVAAEHGSINWYTDYRDMLRQDDLDLVYVAVPPKFHERIVLDTIEAGKHVFCEKPLANSVEEAYRMKKAAEQAGIIHAMHFPLNYSSSLTKFAQLIEEGYIGELRRINLVLHFPHWPRLWQQNDWVGGREQGGFVLEVGVHWIQALQKLFGRVEKVQSDLQFPADPSACENGIIAQMVLENGTPVFIDGLSSIAGVENIEFAVYGTKGTVLLRNWRTLLAGKNGEALQEVVTDDIAVNTLMAELAKALRGEVAELYDFGVGLEAQIVLEALRHPVHGEWQDLSELYSKYIGQDRTD